MRPRRLAPAAAVAEYTVLFAEVTHSMDIAAAGGPERMREIVAGLVDRGVAAVRRFGDTVDKFTGDGCMADCTVGWRPRPNVV